MLMNLPLLFRSGKHQQTQQMKLEESRQKMKLEESRQKMKLEESDSCSCSCAGYPFVCRFPFSFFVARSLESLRMTAENTPGDTIKALQQQFRLLSFSHGLDEALSEDLLKRYVFDFTCMYTPHSSALDQTAQADLVWKILRAKGGKAPTLLSDIHGRFWKCEAEILGYIQLVDR